MDQLPRDILKRERVFILMEEGRGRINAGRSGVSSLVAFSLFFLLPFDFLLFSGFDFLTGSVKATWTWVKIVAVVYE